ncbi:unnamed protein product [Closterium sp. Naga37s-1]|nr:unnamed protein product [Closterium sp. Naga37s-1]
MQFTRRFQVGAELGKGGFGLVNKCSDLTGEMGSQPLAVKTIDKVAMYEECENAGQLMERHRALEREVKILGLLRDHPNIVQVRWDGPGSGGGLSWEEAGTGELEEVESEKWKGWGGVKKVYNTKDRFRVVMELCDGGTLKDHLVKQMEAGTAARKKIKLGYSGGLPEKEAVDVFRQLVEAVQYCHAKSVVHRDIKLENVLLALNQRFCLDCDLQDIEEKDEVPRLFTIDSVGDAEKMAAGESSRVGDESGRTEGGASEAGKEMPAAAAVESLPRSSTEEEIARPRQSKCTCGKVKVAGPPPEGIPVTMDTTPSQPSDSQPKPTDDSSASSAKPADTGAGTSGGSEENFTSEKEIIARWNELRADIQRLYSRIAEHEQELAEHRLVSAAIEGMDPSRRCFRAVGGVLVERRIGEVVPAVARNAAALDAVVTRLAETLAKKRQDLAALEARFNIRVRPVDELSRGRAGAEGGAGGSAGGGAGGAESSKAAGSSQGVLVGTSAAR